MMKKWTRISSITLPTGLETRQSTWLRSTDLVGSLLFSFYPWDSCKSLVLIACTVEALDHLLDQEGLEVDPINRMERETPLHKAVQYANKEKEHGLQVVEMLIDAGADPRFVPRHPRAAPLHLGPAIFNFIRGNLISFSE